MKNLENYDFGWPAYLPPLCPDCNAPMDQLISKREETKSGKSYWKHVISYQCNSSGHFDPTEEVPVKFFHGFRDHCSESSKP